MMIMANPVDREPPPHRILFASPHCLLDFTSGAAVATAQTLQLLATDFQSHAFCSRQCDAPDEVPLEELLAGRPHVILQAARIIETALEGWVPLSIFQSASSRGLTKQEVPIFLDAYTSLLDLVQPQVLLTYGGDPVSRAIMKSAKGRGIKVVFLLHNFAYGKPETFANVDYAVVPSEFSRRYYSDKLGLVCHVLPYVLDSRRVATDRQPQYLTFVNPQPAKGLFIFARIAEVLASRRPDIPLLVVKGRSRPGWQQETGIDLSRFPNLTVMPSQSDPRQFYALTKLLLMPSLWSESFGLVAAEAMLNGIPVLVSNRGALPETVSEAGFLLDIPARYTPQTNTLPADEEVEPWVETIDRLWDDAEAYQQASHSARRHAQQWLPERLGPVYCDFFGGLAARPVSDPNR
jgi:hypothetical protein